MVAAGPLGALLVADAIGIQPQLITVGPSGAVLVAIGNTVTGCLLRTLIRNLVGLFLGAGYFPLPLE